MDDVRNEVDLRVKFKLETGVYHSYDMHTLGAKGFMVDKSFKRDYVIWLEDQLIKNK